MATNHRRSSELDSKQDQPAEKECSCLRFVQNREIQIYLFFFFTKWLYLGLGDREWKPWLPLTAEPERGWGNPTPNYSVNREYLIRGPSRKCQSTQKEMRMIIHTL